MTEKELDTLAKAFVDADKQCEHCADGTFHLTEEHEEEYWDIPEDCQFLFTYMVELRNQRNAALKRISEMCEGNAY